MDKIRELKDKYAEYLLYSLIWLACALLINYYFSKNHKTFLWAGDGDYQHFVSYNYLCEYLKNLIRNPKSISMFNFSLGQGLDILSTLSTYDFTDPICILTTFLFPLSRLQRYTIMTFTKLYLVGFSFIFYCRVREKKGTTAIAGGAIAYAFSEATLVYFARHPNFINWAYFLPFLLSGIELLRKKDNPVPLILFVFWNAITNYYTLYMNIILSLIYIIVIAIWNYFKNSTSKTAFAELKLIIKIAIFFMIGILLASFIMLPGIFAYLSNSRKAESTGYLKSAWLYDSLYYKNLYNSLFSPYYDPGYSTRIGLNALMCIPLSVLFADRKHNAILKTFFMIMLVMLCIPLCGRLMNGMGYACNRWSYAFPFFASAAFVELYSTIIKPSKNQGNKTIFIIILYLLISGITINTNKIILSLYKYDVLFLISAITVMYGLAIYLHYSHIDQLMLILVIAGAVFQIHYTFSENHGNYNDTFTHHDIAEQNYHSSSMAASGLSNDFYRIETEEDQTNIDGMNRTNGTEVWWSLIPTDMFQYHKSFNLRTIAQNCRFYGLDGRIGLMQLGSVKYYTCPISDTGFFPYGYEKIRTTNDYQVFENPNALPIGYTYTGFIDKDYFETLDAIEKEQAILQAAVLEEKPDIGEPISPSIKQKNILDYEIVEKQNVSISDHYIDVVSPNNTIMMSVNVPSNNNLYFFIKDVELLQETAFLQVNVSRNTADNHSISKNLLIGNNTYQWYSDCHNFVFDLGYGYEGQNTITLTFMGTGKIYYDAIQIIAMPMDDYDAYANKLGEHVLKNVENTNDTVKGMISVPDERILQFAIPYSSGWKAYIDGEKAKIFRSDIMYMSILLSPGEHIVELKYHTPGLNAGLIISGLTVILTFLLKRVLCLEIHERKIFHKIDNSIG